MCGIAGLWTGPGRNADRGVVEAMTRSLTHRGPDEEGYLFEEGVGLGQRRLSIIDLSGGRQPIWNEDKTVVTVFNGEIFNYVELREDLEKKGHRFYTHTDTETIVHAYEEYGRGFLDKLNGQFAIAVWDRRKRTLVLARDRVGIRPLYYSDRPDGTLAFASEIKSLFKIPGFRAEMDPQGLNQIFTFWVTVPPRTPFVGVQELGPGECMWITPEKRETFRYWRHRFPDAKDYPDKPIEHWIGPLRELMNDSIRLQMRADVPVASYLSGGVDSSILSSLVKKFHNPDLLTYSVAFKDPAFDERAFQIQVAEYLGTKHSTIDVDAAGVADTFPQAVWYGEKPMIRTAPAPLFDLAGLVRRSGVKVVLTGEGADEIFAGYNIFREDKVRRFWARQPESKARPLLLSNLYAYINKNQNPAAQAFWRAFFAKGLTDTENPYYSHLIRWNNTAYIKGLMEPSLRARMDDEQMWHELGRYMEPDMMRWHPLCRAQYLEMSLFMSGYLLSSQGDRMMMGNSIEGRFPFLDHRVVEFGATVPPKYKIRFLEEKHILKKAFAEYVPEPVVKRPKQPYRAPIGPSFLGSHKSEASSMLDPETIRSSGYFNPQAAEQLIGKLRKATGSQSSAREEMALVGMVSLHLLHRQFVEGRGAPVAPPGRV